MESKKKKKERRMDRNEILLNKQLLVEASEKLGRSLPKSLVENDLLSISGRSMLQWDFYEFTQLTWGILPSSCSPTRPSPVRERRARHPWTRCLRWGTLTCEVEESNPKEKHEPHAPQVASPRDETYEYEHHQQKDCELPSHSVINHFYITNKKIHLIHFSLPSPPHDPTHTPQNT